MLFLLQMAGDPGSGKSTLAREIGRVTGAVVLDKDIVKSAALTVGADEAIAAPLAYETQFDLTQSFLGQGFSVVLDSPAYFTRIREHGRRLAAKNDGCYYIVECIAGRELIAERLTSRERMASQLGEPVVDPYARAGTAPLHEAHLTIDMSRPLGECVRDALEYIGHDAR